MKLTEQDAKLFFDLTWSLHFFVNQRLKILPSVRNMDEYLACSTEEKHQVREALYENKHLIDAFVKENPQKLSKDKLSIVSKWKDCVSGDFYIERFLKKHAIFISEEDRVYGVCGLYEGFDEIIHPSRLPILVNTVLLPFHGKIVYDGLFQPYNVYFGSGIRSNLKETYLTAKQNNRIIESLESKPLSARSDIRVLRNWESEIASLYEKAKQLKGGSDYPPIYSSASGLIKAGLEFAQAAVSVSADSNTLYKSLKKIERELKKAYTILERDDR